MALEIERRFLLKTIPVLSPIEQKEIIQYYNNSKERFRAETNRYEQNMKTTYFKTIKQEISPGVIKESESEITFEEWNKAIKSCNKYIHKTRIVYNDEYNKFEIDKFHHIALIILEVEFTNEEEMKKFQLPEKWLPYLIKEITGEKEFSNYNLAYEKSEI
jgi:CYTH domain-containing protein